MTKRLKQIIAGVLLSTLLFACLPAQPARAYTALYYGCSGYEVMQLQRALNALGYQAGTVDGKYGAYTENAVRMFQRDKGLYMDGMASDETQAAIYAALGASQPTAVPTAVPYVAPAPTSGPVSGAGYFGGNYASIRRGHRGARVKLLQDALNRLGYSCGKADGIFGSGTYNALVRFQSAHGLGTDGVAGMKTLQAIEAALNGGAPGLVTPSPVPTAVPTAAPVVTATPDVSGTWQAPGITLRPGSKGTEVLSLQLRLRYLGWLTAEPNGVYGSETTAAVTAFQRRCGLTADGIAGPRTYARLKPANAPKADGSAPTVSTPTPAPTAVPYITAAPTATPAGSGTTLRRGMSGPAVEQLQKALAFLDYATATYGTYDNATVAAVKSFQAKNGLGQDGIAGPQTLNRLYGGSAVKGDSGAGIAANIGVMNGPAVSQLRLLHWFNDVKPTLKNKQTFLAYDPVTGLAWTLRIMSLGRHADVEPLTATDTAIQFRAFGNRNDWGPKPVYIQLPSGVWTVATMHNVAHGSQTIQNNNFDGQNCVHFLRDMDECQKNDPNYGVSNQTTLRSFWKALTGQELKD